MTLLTIKRAPIQVVVNSLAGEDVYKGVLKAYVSSLFYSCNTCCLLKQDYTSDDVNVDNFLVLLGNNILDMSSLLLFPGIHFSSHELGLVITFYFDECVGMLNII